MQSIDPQSVADLAIAAFLFYQSLRCFQRWRTVSKHRWLGRGKMMRRYRNWACLYGLGVGVFLLDSVWHF